jgi:rsbT co-antagonist protein RsbR
MTEPGFEVTLTEWQRRKAFVGFTDEDAQLLRELRPVAEATVDDVVEGLYSRFLQFEETRVFFPDDSALNRVKALQKEYFLKLTRGEYGKDYLTDRMRVGRTHQRIGLSPGWYIAAYSTYIQLVVPHVITAFGSDTNKAWRMSQALIKLMVLDMGVTIMTYISEAEAVIQRQAHEILELSTPVIQVWDGVLVAPLIGTLDSRRTQQVMGGLLERIVETRSSVALLDITGVPAVDTQTARHLIDTMTAVRLLGAQMVVTGVRPAIAQSLVHLGVDLGQIVTRPTLAAGLRFALDALNVQVIRKE